MIPLLVHQQACKACSGTESWLLPNKLSEVLERPPLRCNCVLQSFNQHPYAAMKTQQLKCQLMKGTKDKILAVEVTSTQVLSLPHEDLEIQLKTLCSLQTLAGVSHLNKLMTVPA